MTTEIKHLFIEPGILEKNAKTVFLKDPSYYHYLLRVLRFRSGNRLLLIDGRFCACVQLIDIYHREKSLKLKVEELRRVPQNPFCIVLYAGLAKGDTCELVIDQATQLGVAKIVFFESEFTQVKAESISADKLKRWRKIAVQASQQAQRFDVPEIVSPLTLPEVFRDFDTETKNILFYEEAQEYTYTSILKNLHRKINIYIGAEGGFSKNEVKMFLEKGAQVSCLSKWRLRTATACAAALSLIFAELCCDRTL